MSEENSKKYTLEEYVFRDIREVYDVLENSDSELVRVLNYPCFAEKYEEAFMK